MDKSSEKTTRISVMELIDICGYAIGKDAAADLKKHWEIYHNYSRIKNILTTQMVAKNSENTKLKQTIKKMENDISRLSQVSIS